MLLIAIEVFTRMSTSYLDNSVLLHLKRHSTGIVHILDGSVCKKNTAEKITTRLL